MIKPIPLTKREQFALAAMQGLLAGDTDANFPIKTLVARAVETADLMIKELNKEKKDGIL